MEKAVELARSGLSYREASERSGVHEEAIGRRVRTLGLPRVAVARRRRVAESVVAVALEAFANGAGLVAAARQAGIAPGTLVHWHREQMCRERKQRASS